MGKFVVGGIFVIAISWGFGWNPWVFGVCLVLLGVVTIGSYIWCQKRDESNNVSGKELQQRLDHAEKPKLTVSERWQNRLHIGERVMPKTDAERIYGDEHH